ncbi:MAG: Ribosome maturation factor rimM [Firmicutes bacterium]|nr:Ribosome maturation factor rimM [Bacillota bacterium]
MNTNLITIGKIVAPHGVRGDVRVIALTDFPERFQTMKQVLLDNGQKLDISGVKYHKQDVLMKFRGLDDRNAVEALKGKLLQVTKEELVDLPEGHYYTFDIIGLAVYDEDGQPLGTITDVITTGSNDVYVAEVAGKTPVLIPALKDVVKNIDLPNKRMTVKLQEEWE